MRDNTALIERVREGDKQAENRMVEENMGLVYSIARRFLNRGYDAEDLTQIGAIGLIKAVKKFNPEFNVQFSTYAVPMITGEIKRFLRDDGAVKISRTLKENAMKGWRCEELLRRKLNRQPTKKAELMPKVLSRRSRRQHRPKVFMKVFTITAIKKFACLIQLPVKKLRTEL